MDMKFSATIILCLCAVSVELAALGGDTEINDLNELNKDLAKLDADEAEDIESNEVTLPTNNFNEEEAEINKMMSADENLEVNDNLDEASIPSQEVDDINPTTDDYESDIIFEPTVPAQISELPIAESSEESEKKDSGGFDLIEEIEEILGIATTPHPNIESVSITTAEAKTEETPIDEQTEETANAEEIDNMMSNLKNMSTEEFTDFLFGNGYEERMKEIKRKYLKFIENNKIADELIQVPERLDEEKVVKAFKDKISEDNSTSPDNNPEKGFEQYFGYVFKNENDAEKKEKPIGFIYTAFSWNMANISSQDPELMTMEHRDYISSVEESANLFDSLFEDNTWVEGSTTSLPISTTLEEEPEENADASPVLNVNDDSNDNLFQDREYVPMVGLDNDETNDLGKSYNNYVRSVNEEDAKFHDGDLNRFTLPPNPKDKIVNL